MLSLPPLFLLHFGETHDARQFGCNSSSSTTNRHTTFPSRKRSIVIDFRDRDEVLSLSPRFIAPAPIDWTFPLLPAFNASACCCDLTGWNANTVQMCWLPFFIPPPLLPRSSSSFFMCLWEGSRTMWRALAGSLRPTLNTSDRLIQVSWSFGHLTCPSLPLAPLRQRSGQKHKTKLRNILGTVSTGVLLFHHRIFFFSLTITTILFLCWWWRGWNGLMIWPRKYSINNSFAVCFVRPRNQLPSWWRNHLLSTRLGWCSRTITSPYPIQFVLQSPSDDARWKTVHALCVCWWWIQCAGRLCWPISVKQRLIVSVPTKCRRPMRSEKVQLPFDPQTSSVLINTTSFQHEQRQSVFHRFLLFGSFWYFIFFCTNERTLPKKIQSDGPCSTFFSSYVFFFFVLANFWISFCPTGLVEYENQSSNYSTFLEAFLDNFSR